MDSGGKESSKPLQMMRYLSWDLKDGQDKEMSGSPGRDGSVHKCRMANGHRIETWVHKNAGGRRIDCRQIKG